jgi:hypothetical protein
VLRIDAGDGKLGCPAGPMVDDPFEASASWLEMRSSCRNRLTDDGTRTRASARD